VKGIQPMSRILLVSILAAGVLLSSCAKDDALRTEGLTLGAGDSIARNTALQVIDPWPQGVEDTDLSIPNDQGGSESGATPPAAAPATSANP
jgi:hypothetical protein